jgi:hypothetical protein
MDKVISACIRGIQFMAPYVDVINEQNEQKGGNPLRGLSPVCGVVIW